jgi:hypothetical protein
VHKVAPEPVTTPTLSTDQPQNGCWNDWAVLKVEFAEAMAGAGVMVAVAVAFLFLAEEVAGDQFRRCNRRAASAIEPVTDG